MSRKVCCIIFIFFINFSQAQKQIDSLKLVLKQVNTDTAKLRIYTFLSQVAEYKDIPLYTTPAVSIAEKILKNDSANSFQKNNPEKNSFSLNQKKTVLKYYALLLNSQGTYELSQGNNPNAISYLQKAFKIQSENKDTIGMTSTLNNIGINLMYMGNTIKAKEAFNKSLNFFIHLNDKRGISQCYNELSVISRNEGNLLQGIDYVFKSLKISEETKDDESTANFYNTLSIYYLDLEDYTKALEFGNKSLTLAKKINSKSTMSNAYNAVAFVYKKRNQLDKALLYLNLSLKLAEELGDKNQLITSYNNIGVLNKDKKNYDNAISYYQKALLLSTEIGAIDGIANANYKLGEVYFIQNNPTKALPLALKAYQLAKQLATPVDIRNSAELLKNIYEATHQYPKALEFTKLYYTMRDSILNDNTKREGLKKQFKYDYDKKAIADSIKITEQKKITATQLAMQQAQIKSQNIIRISLIAGIVVIAIFLIFVANRLQITKKQKLIIEQQTKITKQQKDELELKNKNINEGIEAAKNIQYSVFPNKQELEAVFNTNYFVLFKPYDKLSGDFLWLKQVNNKVYFVLGDCTGHGIPASLLTLLANEFFNKIILQKQITSTAKILQEVNNEIYNYLQRKQKSKKTINEGMDVVICVIDKTLNQLSYSGAKINAYSITKNNELHITESHTIELGKNESLTNVIEHKFNLNKTNQFYFTSDGLKDQLKYKSNKDKFGFKGFEDFIKHNYNLPIEEQKNNIEKLYTEATTNEKQIDDIIVFGFKL